MSRKTTIGEFDPSDDVAILVTKAGGAARPRSFVRLSPQAQDVVLQLEDARIHREAIESSIRDLVSEARAAGASWFQIGVSLGVTGEAARRRYAFDQEDL